jgi:thiol-activated cytolysin
MECISTNVKISAGYSEAVSLNPTAQFAFVGNIIDGKTVTTGGYANCGSINAKRNPIQISNDIQTTAGPSMAASLVQPNSIGNILRGDVMNAMNNITTAALGNGAAISGNIALTHESIYSFQHMSAVVGFGFEAPANTLSIKVDVNANSEKTKSRVVVKFIQPYYSMFLDTDPINLYPTGTIIPEDALVISSVTYGRLGILIIESNESSEELNAAVTFALNQPSGQSYNANASLETKNIMKNSTLT